jgi:hypothetical protein
MAFGKGGEPFSLPAGHFLQRAGVETQILKANPNSWHRSTNSPRGTRPLDLIKKEKKKKKKKL